MKQTGAKIPNQIILCGYNTFNAYGMLRSLGEIGIKPSLILNNCENPFIAKSRYASKNILYFNKPSELPNLILTNIKSDNDYKPIIICCDDPLQSAIDCNYNDLKNHFIISNCKNQQGLITELMNKDKQVEIAAKCGLKTPKTWKINKGAKIPNNIVYPCIVKPIMSIKGSKAQIKICMSMHELQDCIKNHDFLIQEYIEKDYEAIIWGTSIGNNEYYLGGIGRKIRHYPDQNSLSSYGIIENLCNHPNLDINSIIYFLKELNYTGMFSIEIAVKNNNYYFLEMNLRNDGKQYFTAAGGVNLPLIYIKSLIGEDFEKQTLKSSIYYMGETTDIKHILHKKISFIRWLRDLLRTNVFFIFNLKDPLPFIYKNTHKLLKKFHK